MLYTLTLLFAFQFLGELLHRAAQWPVPGPVLGMLGLLLFLAIRGEVGERLAEDSKHLLQHLPLFFIPAGAGLMLYPDVLVQHGAAILVTLVVSTLIAFAITAKLIQYLLRRGKEDGHGE